MIVRLISLGDGDLESAAIIINAGDFDDNVAGSIEFFHSVECRKRGGEKVDAGPAS